LTEAGPKKRIGDIAASIQETVEKAGFSVIRDFVGCGIGEQLIQEPKIPCFGRRGYGMRLRVGMVLHIHVIVAAGSGQLYILDDGWTAVTSDGEPGVVFTAMVLITPDGHELLTPLFDS
jgi:methionyl aminopeptidase